jgi:hypothetical protein
MTVIRSYFGADVTIEEHDKTRTIIGIESAKVHDVSVVVNTAELYAALGVVPKSAVGCGCDRADKNLKAALARAEAAEAKLAAWDADHQNALDLAAERATAAEAKLEKVREVLDVPEADDLKVRMYNRLSEALGDSDRVKLEQEAKALYLAGSTARDEESWKLNGVKDHWRNVARKARELHG